MFVIKILLVKDEITTELSGYNINQGDGQFCILFPLT
jgi:hypothetical protein